MEQLVRVCRTCGHFNPGDGPDRCSNCFAHLTGVDAVPQESLEQPKRRRIPAFVRRRPFVLLVLTLLLGFIVWRLALLFDVGVRLFPPPEASTDISASVAPQTWAQGRRTPENTGFTPDQAPRPGEIRWTFETAKPLLAGPAVVDDRVYLSTEDGRTVALDGRTGRVIWEYRTGFPSGSTPAVAGDMVIYVVRPGLIVALDKETGSRLWEVDIKAPIFASPVVVDGTLYLGTGDSLLHAFDVMNGKELWTFDAEDWIVNSVAYSDGALVVTTQDSSIYLVDARTGRKLLYYDTGYVRLRGGVVIREDRAYFPSDRGWLWAIDRDARRYPGDRAILRIKLNLYVWQILKNSPIQRGGLWSFRLGGDLPFTPAVAHDTLYVANKDGEVFARDADTGAKRWTTALNVELATSPTVAGQTVLVGAKDGRVFGLDAQTGTIQWSFRTGSDEVGASPIVVGDTMYVASGNGTLYAVSGSQ